MLQKMNADLRDSLISDMKYHLISKYPKDTAEWFVTNWRNVEEQHLNLMKQLKGPYAERSADILTLSIAVQVNTNTFIDAATELVQRQFMQHILNSIRSRPKQPKLSVEQFLQLVELVQEDKVFAIVTANVGLLENAPLY